MDHATSSELAKSFEFTDVTHSMGEGRRSVFVRGMQANKFAPTGGVAL